MQPGPCGPSPSADTEPKPVNHPPHGAPSGVPLGPTPRGASSGYHLVGLGAAACPPRAASGVPHPQSPRASPSQRPPHGTPPTGFHLAGLRTARFATTAAASDPVRPQHLLRRTGSARAPLGVIPLGATPRARWGVSTNPVATTPRAFSPPTPRTAAERHSTLSPDASGLARAPSSLPFNHLAIPSFLIAYVVLQVSSLQFVLFA